jgi:hypothetical protein
MIMERRKELNPYPIDYPVRISKGNPKIGDILNVSLPPIVSCQPNVPCAKGGCYSMKAWNCYPGTRRARRHNWNKLNHNREAYFQDIHDCLVIQPRQKKFPVFFRWHVDGDIPDQDYLERMKDVARAHSQVRMLAFTKNYKLNRENLPQNLTVIPSAWPKLKIPKELKSTRMAWVYDPKNVDERILGNYYVCSGACTNCWACWHIDQMDKDVLFHKH